VKIVSYNLRYANQTDRYPWSARRGPAIKLLTELTPAIVGAQEGLDHQLADLITGLGDPYRLVSEHRHDGGTEENSAIIYNRGTVELIRVEHQWLSDTPDLPGSTSWGNTLPRMYSMATFRRLADEAELIVITTHFDHESADAQIRSAHQLIDKIAGIDADLPLIVMGDFNCGEESEPYAIMTGTGLRDAFLAAETAGPRLGTFNNYGPPDPDGTRIDWILVNDRLTVRSARMVDEAPGGQYPSDHLPVEAVVEF
jgi:endonuclease/exonuclease/phosphatase family metal-dependent hydrolase